MTDSVIVVSRGDDGWILGAFEDKDSAKEYVKTEVEFYEPYECDYWKCVVGEGESILNDF